MGPPDEEAPLLSSSNGESHGHHAHKDSFLLQKVFSPTLGAVVLAIFGLLAWLVRYPAHTPDALVAQYYLFYIHVATMVYLGFGFLMTFLRRYSYSAVALTLLVSALVTAEALVVLGAAQQMYSGPRRSFITLDFPLLIDSLFAAAAALISFGALLGKATPTQLVWLVLIETVVYAGNAVTLGWVGIADIGGSVTIHAFGAYFGLAASLFLSPAGTGSTHTKNGASYTSDMTAMIGTTLLMIFWPSFNAALASAPGAPFQFQTIVMFNTVLSLVGSTLATFVFTTGLTGKLDMVHIQNATLAGGVAIGSAANMNVQPGGALGVGLLAGLLSTAGYVYLSPRLERKLGLCDTCGVHNLHAMPGVLGGVVAALGAGLAHNVPQLALGHSGWTLAYYELAGLAGSVAVAIAAGSLSGFLISRTVDRKVPVEHLFDDAHLWHECPHEE